MKYKEYTVDELLQDDYFISSILHPTQESREFWDFLIQSGNLSAQDFEEAAFFIEVVNSRKEKLLRKEKEALWSKIEIENKIIKEWEFLQNYSVVRTTIKR